jgi:integrase/recombinase XerD
MTIENQHFADPTIQYVRALFLNSVYTGFAFADATMLKEEHFEWNTDGRVWCLLYRQKSEELTAIPILKYAAVILNQYRNRLDFTPGGTLFPKITNQTVNKALKIIQAVCGIPFNLTFHIARHTFATTIALKNGIPMETVQIMMGHQKITTT